MAELGRSTKLGRRTIVLFLIGLMASATIAACGGKISLTAGANGVGGDRITLVSFAVTRAAYKAILPKFTREWKEKTGRDVVFSQSFGPSGSQTRAVVDGLPADIVHLGLGLDVQKIQQEGLIEPGWETETPQRGIVTRSVVALIVRPGNPQGIKDWADLARDGVKWITADPKSSGAARWNFVALWNSIVASGGDEEKAKEFLTRAFRNVPILPRDAREATDAFFKQGQADALINYENEVLLAIKKGQPAEYTIPPTNIAIDNPAAIVDKNVTKHGNRQVVEAFLKFLYSPAAQEEFARVGFRPVDDTLSRNPELAKKYPAVKNLASIQDYGGWQQAQKKFFADGALFDKIREQ